MLTKFNMTRDINGYNGFGIKFSNGKYQALLSAGVQSNLTVPASKDSNYPNILAVFSFEPGDSVWVSLNGTPTIPVSGTFAECDCDLNPMARQVEAGDVLSFISTDTTDQIGVSFYAVA